VQDAERLYTEWCVRTTEKGSKRNLGSSTVISVILVSRQKAQLELGRIPMTGNVQLLNKWDWPVLLSFYNVSLKRWPVMGRGMRVSASWAKNTIVFELTQESSRKVLAVVSLRVLCSQWVRLVMMSSSGETIPHAPMPRCTR
jgi:hypothetical protein